MEYIGKTANFCKTLKKTNRLLKKIFKKNLFSSPNRDRFASYFVSGRVVVRQRRRSRDTWIAEVRDPGKTDPDRVVLDHAADHGVDDDGQRQDVVEAAGFQQAVADGGPAGVDRPRPHRRDKVAQQPYPVPPVQGVQVNGRLALQARVARGPKALGEVRRLRPAVVVFGGRVYDRRVRRLRHGQHPDERAVQPFRRRDAVQREHRGPRVCPEHFARRSTSGE